MILVTGGAGYIGSHSVIELDKKGYNVLIADNFINSSPSVLKTLNQLTNKEITHINVDVCNYKNLKKLTVDYNITGIIHFAAFKSVGESVEFPIKYYENNILSLTNILKLSQERKIKNIVFSSSCTVYGNPKTIPVDELTALGRGESPYGKTKIFAEEILKDFHKSHRISICKLRYFNPIGAHKSGLIGDYPDGKPNNLLPYITQVAAGIRGKLSVFGNDYNTLDGSCIRDYIHVVDLAKAHVNAIEYNINNPEKLSVFNIGTGNGVSVIELIRTFEKVNKVRVNYEISPRRDGDAEAIYADCKLAKVELLWKAELNLEDMLSSAWNFQKKIIQ